MTTSMIALITAMSAAAAGSLPTRVPVESYSINPTKSVSHVEAMRVDFGPGQVMPEHLHPMPVVCFVANGRFAVSIGNAPVRTIGPGEATLEPAGMVVHYFRNLSTTEHAQLYCAVLAGADDTQLSVMLPK